MQRVNPSLHVRCLLLAVLVVFPAASWRADSPADGRWDLAELGWLAGAWSGPKWGGEFVAVYVGPAGGKILGHSELHKDDGTLGFYEFEVFEARADGILLIPHPGGKRKALAFPLTKLDVAARKATFENPENDFPTRLVYHRAADDRLVITLDDPHGSSEEVQVFDLARVMDSP